MDEFNYIIKDLLENDKVNEMKIYMQHCNTSCFEHSYNVSYICYKICKKLNFDYVSASRGAMLHDFFLYDWRKSKKFNFHAYKHGKIAYNNAIKEFKLNEIEKNMILRHMWPGTIVPPKYKEGFVLTLADKWCATKEIVTFMFSIIRNNPIIQYGYLFYIFIFKNF